MTFQENVHRRKSIRMRNYDYSQAGFYFVTACTHERRQLFGDVVNGVMVMNEAGRQVEAAWRDLPFRYEHVELGEFVVMPNHFHGIVCFSKFIGGKTESGERAIRESPLQVRRRMGLPRLMGRFKMVSAKNINQLNSTIGMSVWQRNYHEHVIRSETAYLKIAEYICNNPQQWAEDIYHA